jgi:diguanylate cyclase (GGDEF)-like protein
MNGGSIIKQATQTARNSVMIVILASLAVIALLVAERMQFQRAFSVATQSSVGAVEIAGQLKLQRERLSAAAGMATATGEANWSLEYRARLAALEKTLSQAIGAAPADLKSELEGAMRAAAASLEETELLALDLSRIGNAAGASGLLDGSAYQDAKRQMETVADRFAEGLVVGAGASLTTTASRAQVNLALLVVAGLAVFALCWLKLMRSLGRSEAAFSEAEARIRDLALNDTLTGLPNRRAFNEQLERAVTRAAKGKSRLAVLAIDLDRFKPINDRFGHLTGDAVLVEIGKRLAKAIRPGELVARTGGDEFVAVISYPGHAANEDNPPAIVARRLSDAVCQAIVIDGVTHQVGATVGIATFPTDAATSEDLLRRADVALYRAKEDGRGGIRAFDIAMDADLNERAQLETDLKRAVRNGEIVPYFQPLVDLQTGAVIGFEALARWKHPARGMLAPSLFIHLAEQTGLIGDLTLTILRQACEQAKLWPDDLCVAVNVSPTQLSDPWLPERILKVVKETGLPPQRLEIEITENALVTDLAVAKRTIVSLKNQGVRVALDDFGTGYSSLCHLSELPFDKIKIDQSFIQTLHDRKQSATIVTAIVGLGRSLGLPTIAEGVERVEDVAALKAMGCEMGQGFHYAKPIPGADVLALIERLMGETVRAAA